MSEMSQPVLRYERKARKPTERNISVFVSQPPNSAGEFSTLSRCFLRERERDVLISHAVLLLSQWNYTVPPGRRQGDKSQCPVRFIQWCITALCSLTLLCFCLCFAGILFLLWIRPGMCVSEREWAWGCKLHLSANNILAGNLQEIKLGA